LERLDLTVIIRPKRETKKVLLFKYLHPQIDKPKLIESYQASLRKTRVEELLLSIMYCGEDKVKVGVEPKVLTLMSSLSPPMPARL